MKQVAIATRVAAAVATLVFGIVHASALRAETIDGRRIIIIDGDTVALPCEVAVKGCSKKIRLLEIDAPESHKPSCDAELAAGLRAKERLASLVRAGDVEISREGLDRYGRTLANIRAPAGDVGEILMKEGLALRYFPGRKAKAARIAHWCGPGNW